MFFSQKFNLAVASRVVVVLGLINTGLFSFSVQAENTADLSVSLDDLMKMEVSTATKDTQNIREAASIMTVILANDIKNAMCRDLMDVLSMVPGIQIVKESNNPVAASRGINGYEGRMLFMVDGMPLSDLLFGGFIVSNSFPIHLIDRIEVIRGPGSVTYGGTAELAVINIITRKTAPSMASVRTGFLSSAIGVMDIGASFHEQAGPVSIDITGSLNKVQRSDGTFSQKWAHPDVKHTDSSAGYNGADIVMGLRLFEKTTVRAYFHEQKNRSESFTATEQDSEADIARLRRTSRATIQGYIAGAQLEHRISLNEDIELAPSFSVINSFPSNKPGKTDPKILRLWPAVALRYHTPGLTALAGAEYFADLASVDKDNEDTIPFQYYQSAQDSGSDSITIGNAAVYGNVHYRLNPIGIALGLRYDWNEFYGSKLNPRAGLILTLDRFNAKLLYSSAFRAPLAGNNAWSEYGLQPSRPWRPEELVPETIQVGEIEIGYAFTDSIHATANVFGQKVKNTIELRIDPSHGNDTYNANGGSLTTWGAEAELRYVSERFRTVFNASWFKPESLDAKTYVAIHDPNRLMGVSALKLYLNQSVYLTRNWSIHANGGFLSDKAGMEDYGKTKTVSSQVIIDFGTRIVHIAETRLNASLSIHDILNSRLSLVTPYRDSGYDTFPYKGRELVFSIDMEW